MSRHDAEKIEMSVTFKRETDLAVLINDGDKDIWLPKSQLGSYEFCDTGPGEVIDIEVAEWLAKEKGLI